MDKENAVHMQNGILSVSTKEQNPITCGSVARTGDHYV
jgi:hypothetical protein